MANQAIYPYGQNGKLPSGYPIANDLETDDAAMALSAAMGVQLGTAVHQLDVEVNGIAPGTREEITYSRADGEPWLLDSNGSFYYNVDRLGIWIPITPHKSYVVVSDENSSVVIGILKTKPDTSTTTTKVASFATGFSGRIVLSAEEEYPFVAPSDAGYIFMSLKTPAAVYPKLYEVLATQLGLEDRVEELETPTTFDKDVLVIHGYYLKVADGTVSAAASFSTSDYINVKGSTRISLPYAGQTSSATPIAFYDRNKILIYAKTNVYDSMDLFDIEVPSGAKYIRVCTQNTNAEWSLSIYGQVQVSEVDFGIFPNPFVEVGGFTRDVVVTTADAPSGLPTVRCAGSFAKNGNIVYTIATCTPSGADNGKRKSVFKAYNVSTDEDVTSNVVFDGGDGAYMNEVVFYDANGVLGTAGTLYAFAIYHADYTKLYINETDPDDLDFVYKTSTDGGETWGAETSLKSLLPDGFLSIGCSPANPIVLANGTFCLAGFFMKPGTGVSKYRSGLITKKNGYNWKAIPIDIDDTNIGENETTIVEYGNNSVMLNIRSNYDVYSRAIYYTSEILPGEDFVFHRHPSWRTMLVPDSHLCEGSITKFGGLYYYSSVDFTKKPDQTRQNILLYVSPDACKWYPLLYLFIGTTKGYSHLLTQGNNLYVMFESENSTIDYADITTRVNALLSGGMSTIISHTPDWRLLEVAKNREELNQ